MNISPRATHPTIGATLAGAVVALTAIAACGGGAQIVAPHRQQPASASSPILISEDSTVRRVDGTVVARLAVPAAYQVGDVTRVPSGWLIGTTRYGHPPSVWFQSGRGPARWLVDITGGPVPSGMGGMGLTVSGDGSMVIVSGPGRMVSYDLPSLRVRHTLERPGVQFYMEQQLGDEVLLSVVHYISDFGSPLLWNARTGVVTEFGNLGGVSFWSTATGDAIYPGVVCYSDGSCTSAGKVPPALAGWVAPAGSTIAFSMRGSVAMRVPASPGGVQRPRTFDNYVDDLQYWLDGTTLVGIRSQTRGVYVCHTTTLHCDEVKMPPRPPEWELVGIVGGG